MSNPYSASSVSGRAATDLPLSGVLVLDFSQFLAGPVAALRLADLGARVIKIERRGVGELGRTLAFGGLHRDGDSVSFQAMNRNKQSVVADLKDPADLQAIRKLVARADVMIQNFRPGVMDRIGLDYESAAAINPRLVYASISGYGDEGPWRDLPGQDLLVQSISGLPWLNGEASQGPVPVGLSVVDVLGSCHLATGVLALLMRRERTGKGGLVETSLLEGVLDLQFELLTGYLNDRTLGLRRGGRYSASAFLSAPYGIYPTRDGYLALAMNSVPRLGDLLKIEELELLPDESSWWTRKEEISRLLAATLTTEATQYWLDILQPADIWCAPVLTLPQLVDHPGFASAGMIQETIRAGSDGLEQRLLTTRSPLRIDGQRLVSSAGAPRLGADTDAVLGE